MENKVEIGAESVAAILKKLSDDTGYLFNGIIINVEKDLMAFTGTNDTNTQAELISLWIKNSALMCKVDLDTFIDKILAEVGRKNDARQSL